MPGHMSNTPAPSGTGSEWQIGQVQFHGAKQTRKSVLQACIDPLFETTGPLQSMLTNVQCAVNQLSDLEIFDHVSIQVDSPKDRHGQLDITFNVKEKPRFRLESGTQLGNQEGSVHASGILRNMFGGAENVAVQATFGTRTRSSYQGSLVVPIVAHRQAVQLHAYQTNKSNQDTSSHDLQTQAVALRLLQTSRLGHHTCELMAANREIGNLADACSLPIRHQAGWTRKLSVSHSLVRASGSQIHSELFTTQQSVFFKQAVQSKLVVPITSDWYASLSARLNLVVPLSGKHALPPFPDRLFLGGPTCVRGFKYHGLGPKSSSDVLGGNVSYAVGVSLIGPIPLVRSVFKTHPEWVRMHGYVNGGMCDSVFGGKSLHRFVTQCPSVTMGLGLAFKHPMVRLEVNFGVPLVVREDDRVHKGLAVGLGVDFL